MIDSLDPEQKTAVHAGSGLVIVKAGAGTGKTRVLTTRIAHLVVNLGQPARSILATTFTRKAALEMLERVAVLGGDRVSGVQIRTVDAVAARLLRRQWRAAGLQGPDFLIADDDEAEAILQEVLLAKGLLSPDMDSHTQRNMTDDVRLRIQRWKENGLQSADLATTRRPAMGMADSDAADAFLAFEGAMLGRQMLEFSDLCRLAARALLASPEALAAETEAVRWLLVDEAQDLNRAQIQLLSLLSSHHANVTLVGDDDQSLYSWRGAVPSLMEKAPSFFPAAADRGIQNVTLIRNRRCTEPILAIANRIVDHNERAEPKVLSSGREGEEVAALSLHDEAAEAAQVGEHVRHLLAAGTPRDEIAILGRTSLSIEPISRRLLTLGIPHAFHAGQPLWDRAEVRDVLAYVKLAVHPSLDVALRRAIARPTRGMGHVAIAEIIARCASRYETGYEAIEGLLADGAFRGEGRQGARELAGHLRAIHEAAQTGILNEDLVDYVIRDIGYGTWAFEQQKAQDRILQSSFDAIRELARARVNLPDLIADVAVSGPMDEKDKDAVHLGTIHGSKGLEWDHVILVAFEGGILPNQRAISLDNGDRSLADPDDVYRTDASGSIEEERRLAHVALTRARHTATITMARTRHLRGVNKMTRLSQFALEGEISFKKIGPSPVARNSPKAAKPLLKSQRRTMW